MTGLIFKQYSKDRRRGKKHSLAEVQEATLDYLNKSGQLPLSQELELQPTEGTEGPTHAMLVRDKMLRLKAKYGRCWKEHLEEN